MTSAREVGRRPNTGDLGLDAAGILTNDHGFITVDDQRGTTVPGIWAMGDCNGCGAFTHTTYNDCCVPALCATTPGSGRPPSYLPAARYPGR